jgi:peptidoglycan hydrolase-like protein with peptidoglycan-binding domain
LPNLKEQAEAAERDLRLEPTDRQRLQVALTSLGFDTRGDDGVFGPRSREMIVHWQRARRHSATGFVTRAQQQAILKEASAALSEYDGRRKAEEDARTTAVAPVAPLASLLPESTDGLWRGTYECGHNGYFTLRPELHLKGGSGTWYAANYTTSIGVSIDGTNVHVMRRGLSQRAGDTPLLGQLDGNSIRASNKTCSIVLMRAASSAVINTTYDATVSGAASPTLPSPDGAWRGTYRCNASPQTGSPFVIDLKLHLTNGSAMWRSAGPGVINGNSFDVAVSVVQDISRVVRTAIGQQSLGAAQGNTLTGQYDGATINATGRERSSGRDCTLALTRS